MNKPPNPPRKGRGRGRSQPGGSSSNEQALKIPKLNRVYYSHGSGTIAGVIVQEEEYKPRPKYAAKKADSPLTDSEPEKVEAAVKVDVGEEKAEDEDGELAMAIYFAENAKHGGGKRKN